jgi:hypothetical protein
MTTKIVLLEHYGKSRAGEVVELPDDEAQTLINTGNAMLYDAPKVNKPAEKSIGNRSKTK